MIIFPYSLLGTSKVLVLYFRFCSFSSFCFDVFFVGPCMLSVQCLEFEGKGQS